MRALSAKLSILFLIVSNNVVAATPTIKNGVLDLRGQGTENIPEIDFAGEWEFYWEKLLDYSDFSENKDISPDTYIHVPTVWNNISINGGQLPPHGYATYRIKVMMEQKEPIAIKFGNISTAFRAYANNMLIKQGGTVGTNKEESKPGYSTGLAIFQPSTRTFDLIIHVSNYHYSDGGLWNDLSTIGRAGIIQESWSRSLEILTLLLGCILIIAIYHIGLYQLNPSLKPALFFALFCLIIAIRVVVTNEIYILKILPNFNWNMLIKLEYITLMVGTIVFVYFIEDLFEEFRLKQVTYFINIANSIAGGIVAFTSVNFFTRFLVFYQTLVMIGALYSLYIVIRGVAKGNRAAQILVAGLFVLVVSIVNDILYVNRVIYSIYLIPYGFMFFVVVQAYMLGYLYQRMYGRSQQLAKNLEKVNINLENKVAARTEEIKAQNEQLLEQNQQIVIQRDNLEEQHRLAKKHRQVITDSISYAKRIQNAVLPTEKDFKKHLKDYFVFYRPRDIVSGDFYWLSTQGSKVIIVAADCTGHGVPGAFMSMLGMAFIAEISSMAPAHSSANILDALRLKVKKSMHQFEESPMQREGIDMALCIYDKNTEILEYAGAASPLYLIRDGELTVYKGERQSVAVYLKERNFTNVEIKVQPDDRFYIFSDGFPDQTSGSTIQKYMVSNFRKLLLDMHKLPMKQQGDKLDKVLNDWIGVGKQIDDITVLGFQLK